MSTEGDPKFRAKADPMFGFLFTMRGMAYGPSSMPHRADVFNDDVGSIKIDTCCTPDTGAWETGICRDGTWHIVEQYPDRDAAKAGHEKWVETIRKDPTSRLPKLGVWNGIEDQL